jgi:nucleoside-diphosphate-sugar epimerase
MKVLVTGGSGMLGSSIKESALAAGHSVVSPTHRDLDLEDERRTSEFINREQPEVIYHCAARVGGIAANIASPLEFLVQNLRIDSSLLGAAAKIEVPNFFYMGSSCMYPKNLSRPMKVEDILSGPLEPTNESYALAKLVGWKTVELSGSNLNWKTVVLSNLYGPRDHFEPDRSHLLAAIIAKVHDAKLNGAPSIEMWGDGSARRQFTYVDDVAEFLVSSLTKLSQFPRTFNLGAPKDFSIFEFYQIVSNQMNYKGKILANLSKPAGMQIKLMDVETSISLGWQPQTSIEEGVRTTASWYEDHVRSGS